MTKIKADEKRTELWASCSFQNDSCYI